MGGPSYLGTWNALHKASIDYPETPTPQQRNEMRRYIYQIVDALGCKRCKNHFYHMMNKSPLNLESRSGLMRWIFDLHNEVNAMQHKPTFTWTQFERTYLSGKRP